MAQAGQNVLNQVAENQSKIAVEKTGQAAVKAAAKSKKATQMAGKLGKVASKASKVAQTAAKLGKIIATVGWIILIIFIIIGLVTFILTGLGLIMAGLEKIAQGICDALNAFFSEGGHTVVKEQEVLDTLTYLEEMDYDLYGYGFSPVPNPIIETTDENGEVKKSLQGSADSYRNIYHYLISDNYVKTVKNSNITWNTMFSLQSRKGCIALYHEAVGQTGLKGGDYSVLEFGSIKVKNNKLRVSEPELFSSTIMEYDLDGWTGRYGMPLEFLLSVHLATLAPDLSYKMTQEFQTEVNILLHKSTGGDINAAIGKKNGDIIATRKELEDIVGSGWTNWNDTLSVISISTSNAYEVFKKYDGQIESITEGIIYKCEGPPLYETIASSRVTAGDLTNLKDTEISDVIDEVEILLKSEKVTISDEQISNIKKDVEEFFWTTKTANEIVENASDTEVETISEVPIKLIYSGIKASTDSTGYKLCFRDMKNMDDNGNNINIEMELSDTYMFDTQSAAKEVCTNLDIKLQELYGVMPLNLESNPNGEEDNINIILQNYSQGKADEFENNENYPIVDVKATIDRSSTGTDQTPVATLTYVERTGNMNYKNLDIQGTYEDEENKLFRLKIDLVIEYDEHGNNYAYHLDFSRKTREETNTALVCSDIENHTATETCEYCQKFIQSIYSAMNKIHVGNFTTYVPYIDSVFDHWFRNVYFTSYSIGNDEIIDTDDEYEKKTGERWTLYETDSDGNYVLYVYFKEKDNGGSGEEYQINLSDVVCKKVEKGTGQYKLSDDGITYIKADQTKKDGEYNLSDNRNVEEFRVGKKAKTKDKNEYSNYNAYELGEPNAIWKTFEVVDSTKTNIQEASDALNQIGLELKYKASYGTIHQVEDGLRGQTNPKIKKLFLDEYYLYDGSKQRAAVIQEAKDKGGSDDPNVLGKDEVIQVSNDLIAEIEGIALSEVNDEYRNRYKATIDEISGPISLTHNSLSAFSILENMRTLDSEYIIHDFKELIVELNYFDKEDLLQAEEEVMMFPVAGISSAGWPVVRYDKKEEFYGTLIHSAEDLKARKEENRVELAKILGDDIESDSDTEATKFPSDFTNNLNEANSIPTSSDATVVPCTDGTCDNYVTINGVTYKQFFQYNYQHIVLPRTDGESGKVGDCGCGFCSTTSILTGYGYDVDLSEMKNKLEQMGMNWNNSDRASKITTVLKEYGITGNWDTSNTSGENLKNTIAQAFEEGKPVLVRIGANTKGPWTSGNGHYFVIVGVDSNGTLYTVDSASERNNLRSVNSGGIQALVDSISGHVKGIWIPDQVPNGTIAPTTASAEFAGFEGGETVVAPITGELVAYGVTARKNLETGESDKVGFIKIRALGSAECKPGDREGCKYFTGVSQTSIIDKIRLMNDETKESTSSEVWLNDNYSEEQLKTLGYDFFWEEYNNAGIGDTCVYLEGFDIPEEIGIGWEINVENNRADNIEKLYNYIVGLDKDADADADENKLSNGYSTQYSVPNLLDNDREYQLKVGETAKELADYVIKDEKGKIYIKEGAAIGVTFSSDSDKISVQEIEIEEVEIPEDENAQGEATEEDNTEESTGPYKVGNYLRIIFRDKKDDIIENVEEYVEVAKGGGVTTLINGKTFEMPQEVLKAQEGIEVTYQALNIQSMRGKNWTNGSPQKQLYELWISQGTGGEAGGPADNGTDKGSHVENGLAYITVDGKDYYTVSVKTTFGNPGDYIQIVFEDGSIIDCIIQDAKGTDSGSFILDGVDYGHGNGSTTCNVLEFNIKGTKDPQKTNGVSYTCDHNFEWWSKKVVRITNGGPLVPVAWK